MQKILLTTLAAAAFATTGYAQVLSNYTGNGSTTFGGAVGAGSLSISNNAAGALDFTYTRGGGNFNDAIVLYFDSVGGGATSTADFTDSADGLRRAISGFDGGANRSTLTFAAGFDADFAIALDTGFAGLWSLTPTNNFGFLAAAGLAPTGTSSNAVYTFSINVANLGLTANSGQSFDFFSTYISTTGFRSTETFGATFSGSPSIGYTPFTAAANNSFTTVPEPSTYALLALSGIGLAGYVARRRARK
jgi:hypothetical protein